MNFPPSAISLGSTGGGGGGGTVTSVGLAAPAEFTISGSPVTTAGSLTLTKASQAQNLVWASPNGSSGVPTFRSLLAADLPTITTLGTIGTGVWQGTLIAGQYGGTGVANTGKTITLGGNLTTSGAFATTLTVTNTTAVTLPNSGTLLSTAAAVTIGQGGTGATTKAPAFDALSPMSASGDIIYGGASGTGTRLAKGSDGQVLTLASGVPSWAAAGGGGSPGGTEGQVQLNVSSAFGVGAVPLSVDSTTGAISGLSANFRVDSFANLTANIVIGTTRLQSNALIATSGSTITVYSGFDMQAQSLVNVSALSVNGALADGTYGTTAVQSITITNGAITAITAV